ncbi:MAG: helix-turn-helix domain-containing protein [Nitriliruptoraceae bacterium]
MEVVTPDTADDAAVEAALESPTRAGIYRRLRLEGRPVSARDVAAMFGLHPNVARSHLDALAEVGLLVTGSRKQPRGGRPARVYVAREQAGGVEPRIPPGGQLAVHAIVQLIAGLAEHRAKLAILAEEQGRKLVSAMAGRAAIRDLQAAAVVATEALRAAFPEVRLAEVEDARVVIEGFDAGLRLVGEVDAQVGDALTIGFVRGALAAAGAPTRVSARGGRAVAVLDAEAVGATPAPAASVDVRRRAASVSAVTMAVVVRAMESLEPGEHLEILTDGEGSPALYARWADRSGHQVVDVGRIRDPRGRRAVRILLRKATGR